MFRKITAIIIIITMFLQINIYSFQNISCIANRSLLSKAKLIMQNDTYSLSKINNQHLIYMDNSSNIIELFKNKEGWHAKHNGMKCSFKIIGKETEEYGDIFIYLLKRDYQIQKIEDNVIYLKSQGDLSSALKKLSLEQKNTEEIIIEDFRQVLDEFKNSGLKEIEEFKKIMTEVVREAERVRASNVLYRREFQKIKAIKLPFSVLLLTIEKYVCSIDPAVHLLGEHLKAKILSEKNRTNAIAKYMVNGLDGSKLLLQKTLIDQIIISTIDEKILSLDIEEESESQNIWIIKTPTKEIHCICPRKKSGAQFGVIMEVKYFQDSKLVNTKKYYAKSHQDYQISRSRESKFTRTTKKIDPLNLKEIIIYKMLDKLDLGAKLHLVINPYARNGLFIVTDGLSYFEEADTLEENRYFPETLSEKREINQFDILGRIFDLSDFNSGNFGIIERKMMSPKWRMIDFRVVKRDEPVSVNSYLKGNDIFNYTKGGILATVLQNQERYDKIQTGLDAIKNLKEDKSFNKHLQDAFKEVFAYIQTIIPELEITVSEFLNKNLEEKDKKSLEQEIKELEEYQNAVKNNLRIIYEGLATEQAEIMLKEILLDKYEFGLDISRASAEKRKRLSANQKEKIFTISENLIVSAGRIFNILGLIETRNILNYVLDKRMKDQVFSLLADMEIIVKIIQKLDAIKLVDEREKTSGLLSILELFRLENVLDFISKIQESKTTILNFNSLKNILMAA